MLRRLLTISLALLLQQPAQGTNDKRPLKLSVATSFCTYSNKAKKGAANLADKLNAMHKSLKAAEKAALPHQLGQAALPQYKEAAATLTIYAQAANAAAVGELQNWAGEQTKTIGQEMYVSGGIDGLMEVLKRHMSTTKGSNKGCIANDGDATGIGKFVESKCDSKDKTVLSPAIEGLAAALDTDISNEGDPESNSGHDDCLINNNPHSSYTAVTVDINLLNGILQIPQAGGFTTSTNVRVATKANSLFTALKTNGAKLKIDLTASTIDPPTDLLGLKNLLKTATSRQALKRTITQYRNKPTDDKSITDDTIKAAFRLTADDQEGGYLKALKAVERTIPTTPGETKSTPLLDTISKQLEAALTVDIGGIYKITVELKKETETLRQNQGKQASEDTCNKIKVEKACNATAACSYNKTETKESKTFKLDVRKATTNGVSVTQPQTGGTTTVKFSGHNNRPTSSENKIL
uniref:Variant surface glycoprotein 1173 n=1 Tax=Trypanosoma brucei TaxID=5691 RepID=M4SZH7_9TRYP|nr:variant surface glycoprotein 1173 [Trypanosoma brucei]